MPEMLTELDKPTDLRVYTIAQVKETIPCRLQTRNASVELLWWWLSVIHGRCLSCRERRLLPVLSARQTCLVLLCFNPLANAAMQILAEGSMTVDEIHQVSKIDHWFLRRLERIANFSKKMQVRSRDSATNRPPSTDRPCPLTGGRTNRGELPWSFFNTCSYVAARDHPSVQESEPTAQKRWIWVFHRVPFFSPLIWLVLER